MPYLKANTTYLVFARAYFYASYASSTTGGVWAISDGTTEIGEITTSATSDSGYGVLGYLAGTISYDSVQTDKEFAIYAKRRSGGGSVYVYGNHTEIEIGIIPLTEGMNNPHILNNVVSSSSDGVRICSGWIDDDGTPTIESTGDCASSVTHNGDGDNTITFDTGVFSAAPYCNVNANNTSSASQCNIDPTTAASATTVRVQCTNTASDTATNYDVYFNCTGAK
jgi:hypothetical protein